MPDVGFRKWLDLDYRVMEDGHAVVAINMNEDKRNLRDVAHGGVVASLIDIAMGVVQAMDLYREHDPVAVVGFGGYPGFPALLAAQILKIPNFLHEQNAVFGRANRHLARYAYGIALSFENTALIEKSDKVTHTGNPVRREVVERDYTYHAPEGDFHLLVTGGSQGSRIFNIVPQAVELLPPALRARLKIVQQCRAEDVGMMDNHYHRLGVAARIAPFFTDIPAQLAAAHLVICRAGASTVAELAVAGRPALFVPLAASLDGDQAQNAKQMQEKNAAWVMAEKDFTPAALSAKLVEFMHDPAALVAAAVASRSLGRPDAADRLADRVINGIGK